MTADMIITAIGQTTDLSFLPASSKLKTTRRGTFAVDEDSLQTSVAGIFAGGDVRRGPATMIEAIADGRKAAIAIDGYLRGVALPPKPPAAPIADVNDAAFKFHLREYVKETRCPAGEAPAKTRKGNFKEVNLGFADDKTCIKEARRCLTCRCTAIPY
jgi:NADPH-dependent glutamate synthase beta subunit-like oxidoreductase